MDQRRATGRYVCVWGGGGGGVEIQKSGLDEDLG